MTTKNTNEPRESVVPTELLQKFTVSAPVLTGRSLRDSDVVGTLTLVHINGRVFLITCNHVLRRWRKYPLQSPIFEMEVDPNKGIEKWLTVHLGRFHWAGIKADEKEDEDGYYDLRVALLPERENANVISDLILPISPISEINGPFTAVLTGYPERKNTRDIVRKRKPIPWTKAWWFELYTEETPSGSKRIDFDWSHKNGNYIFEQQISENMAKFVSTGSAPLPYGTSGGPLIFLDSPEPTLATKHSVIGYGLEYDSERKKITVGPSDVIVGIALQLLEKESNGFYPTIYDPVYF